MVIYVIIKIQHFRVLCTKKDVVHMNSIIHIDYNMAFSISTLVSSLNLYQPSAVALG